MDRGAWRATKSRTRLSNLEHRPSRRKKKERPEELGLKWLLFIFGSTLQHVGSYFPNLGLNPRPLWLQCRFSTTGPLGKSLKWSLNYRFQGRNTSQTHPSLSPFPLPPHSFPPVPSSTASHSLLFLGLPWAPLRKVPQSRDPQQSHL